VRFLAGRYRLGDQAVDALLALVEALAAEPKPPTAVREPHAALRQHIADSLTGLEVPALREATRIADIGAGAGFPGLVLAIALPSTQVDLVESARRKCSVIARLIAAAGIPNARPVPRRAEEWALGEGAVAYDAVTARALAPLPVLVEYAAPLLKAGGVLVAWKGGRDEAEEAAGQAAAAQLGLQAAEVLPVKPFKEARQRHLHVYLKEKETPPSFPRRPGIAAKRPLSGHAQRQLEEEDFPVRHRTSPRARDSDRCRR
jgi:16S rRNA (guanine527-N7)-methyltransferase